MNDSWNVISSASGYNIRLIELATCTTFGSAVFFYEKIICTTKIINGESIWALIVSSRIKLSVIYVALQYTLRKKGIKAECGRVPFQKV